MPVILCCFPTRSAPSLPSSLAAFAPPTTTCAPPKKPCASIATTTPVIQIPTTAIGTFTSTNSSLRSVSLPTQFCNNSSSPPPIAPQTGGAYYRTRADTLLLLKQQYRLAVISNSDGGIQDAIDAAGIADCFECIIDSAHVGVEKPDPAIFRTGLDAMQVQPSESVYVGDVYAIDVLGARSVGMRAILIDPFGVYDHQDCPHISSLSELPDLLRLLNDST